MCASMLSAKKTIIFKGCTTMKMQSKFFSRKFFRMAPCLIFMAGISGGASATLSPQDVSWVFNSDSIVSNNNANNIFELRIRMAEVDYNKLLPIRTFTQQVTKKVTSGSSATIGAATQFDNLTYVSDDYTIEFTSPSVFKVYRKSWPANVLENQPYTSGAEIVFNGIRTSISGNPVQGDKFTVRTAKSDIKATVEVELVCNTAAAAYCPPPATTKKWTGVKLKLKGSGGSFRPIDGKPGFKLDFASAASPGDSSPAFFPTTGGLKKLTLNNMVGDNSRTHQVLSYDMYRKVGISNAPRTGYAQVKLLVTPSAGGPEYIKDYGLYLNVETLDEVSLPTTKHLYEGVYGTDVALQSDVEKFDYDDFGANFGAAPDPLRSTLTALVTANNSAPQDWLTAVQAKADLSQMVKVWAVSSYIRDQDGYGSHGNNFYLAYDNVTNKFTMLPWGTDATYDYEREAAWWTSTDFAYAPKGSLLRNCLANETCFNMYHDALNLARAEGVNTNYAAQNDALFNVIAPFINSDPRQEVGLLDVIEGKKSTEQFMNLRIGQIDQYWVSGCCTHRDEDQDGVENYHDRYPRTSTAGYGDQDSDGAPSTCDAACQATGMEVDNCPDDNNILQKNQDNDSLGNACDVDVKIPNNGVFDEDDRQEIYSCCSKIISVNTVGQPWPINGRVLIPEYEFKQEDMH